MTQIKRTWDLLTEPQRKIAIESIIDFFETERTEHIGIIAAEKLLDSFLETNAIVIYNNGVDDTKKFFRERFEGIHIDIDATLKKFP